VSAHKPRWTIAELGRKVADALATADYEGPANGQVRAVPNERSIRYYTTLGLLDRPVEIRGRTALYGPRHLMQLVAIKRLQAKGHSLAEVQAMLTGASQRKLVRIADVPRAVWDEDEDGGPEAPAAAGAHEVTAGPAALPDRARFWDEVPEEAPAPSPDSEPTTGLPAASAPVLLASMALAPGVTLLFQPARGPDAADAEALRRAAAQLVAELEARGLVIAPSNDPSDDPTHAPVTRAAPDRPETKET
jgi:DNA-binding transcriptional MerR regulator